MASLSVGGSPCPAERETLGRRRMAEKEQIGEARRLEVREIATRQLDVRAGERRRILGEVERAAVGGALEAPRKRGARSQRRELEREEREQRLRQ